jgi:hypothetical protein
VIYHIWIEGWSAHVDQGEREKAKLLGTVEAETFADACRSWFSAHPSWSDFDADKLTHWGCRLFDNEADARARFG